MAKAPKEYKEVRGLSRGLEVLTAMNRMPGGIGAPTEIARECGMHRTTVKRLLETLRIAGYVRRSDKDSRYCLTSEVRRLSEGFVDAGWVEHVAAPAMRRAVRTLLWPCDLTTLEAGFMLVRESTHRWSSLSQHHAMIGARMPLFVTASGRAYMSACSEQDLEAVLDLLGQRTDWIGELARDPQRVRDEIAATRERGYAYNDGEWVPESDFAAIAVPVICADRVLACVNIVFPKKAISSDALRTRYVPALKRLAESISKGCLPWVES